MNSGVSFGSFSDSLLSGEGFSVGDGAIDGYYEFCSSVFCICSFDVVVFGGVLLRAVGADGFG